MHLGNCSCSSPFPYLPIPHTNVKAIYLKHEFINIFFSFRIVSAVRAGTTIFCIPCTTVPQCLAPDRGSIKTCCMHIEKCSVVNYRDQISSINSFMILSQLPLYLHLIKPTWRYSSLQVCYIVHMTFYYILPGYCNIDHFCTCYICHGCFSLSVLLVN